MQRTYRSGPVDRGPGACGQDVGDICTCAGLWLEQQARSEELNRCIPSWLGCHRQRLQLSRALERSILNCNPDMCEMQRRHVVTKQGGVGLNPIEAR